MIAVSYYNANIDERIILAQRSVFSKFKIPLYQIPTSFRHGDNLNIFFNQTRYFFRNFKHVLIVDIDCVPTSPEAVERLKADIDNGYLATGNVQRSNHIQNDEHLFIAPSCLMFDNYALSFIDAHQINHLETRRADVSEEFTFWLEEKGKKFKYYLPERYELAPLDGQPFWKLREGMPNYGRFTWFESGFMHAFESRKGESIDRFVQICDEVIL